MNYFKLEMRFVNASIKEVVALPKLQSPYLKEGT